MPECFDNGEAIGCGWRRLRVANYLPPIVKLPECLRQAVRLLLVPSVTLVVLFGCTGDFAEGGAHLRAAQAAYDGERLVASLDSIKDWHTDNNTGIASALGSGLSPASIEEALSSSECEATEELKLLWSWRDGAASAAPFVWYHGFLSLDDARTERKWLRMNPLVWWDPQYIPILAFEGEWYAAYCGPGVGKAGPVAHYFLEDGPQIVAINLTTFMATMAEAMQVDAIQWRDGAMVDDIRQVHSIHQRNNPGYAFPYYVPDSN